MPDVGLLWYVAPPMWLDWIEQGHGEDTTFDHWPRLSRAALLATAMPLWFLMTRAQPTPPFLYRGF